jgi:sulfate adenylyltransferase subunit 2
MSILKERENESIYIIREIYAQEKNLALLWSMGKDSTVLLWLCKKAFFGELPFPVIHVDTTYKFPEMYDFRDFYAKEWSLDLIVKKNKKALERGIGYENGDAIEVCHTLKTKPLQEIVQEKDIKGLFVGIRSDEHGIRAKEQTISLRKEDFTWDYKNYNTQVGDVYVQRIDEGEHMRIHPLLNWTEIEVWEYMKQENIPVCDLYFAKDGKRYRSLGCQPITKPVNSNAQTIDEIIAELQNTDTDERSGRAQDKEKEFAMQKLRSLGYM